MPSCTAPTAYYEVAAEEGFTAVELGQLALALRTVDPRWRLSHGE
jgi:hypothetical protein